MSLFYLIGSYTLSKNIRKNIEIVPAAKLDVLETLAAAQLGEKKNLQVMEAASAPQQHCTRGRCRIQQKRQLL